MNDKNPDNLRNKILFLQILIAVFVILIIMIAMSVGRDFKFGRQEVAPQDDQETMYGEIEEFGEDLPEATESNQQLPSY